MKKVGFPYPQQRGNTVGSKTRFLDGDQDEDADDEFWDQDLTPKPKAPNRAAQPSNATPNSTSDQLKAPVQHFRNQYQTPQNLRIAREPAKEKADSRDWRNIDSNGPSQSQKLTKQPPTSERDKIANIPPPKPSITMTGPPQLRLVTLNPSSMLVALQKSKQHVSLTNVICPDIRPVDHLSVELFGKVTDLRMDVSKAGARRYIGSIHDVGANWSKTQSALAIVFPSPDTIPNLSKGPVAIRAIVGVSHNTPDLFVWWWEDLNLQSSEIKLLNMMLQYCPNKSILRGPIEQ